MIRRTRIPYLFDEFFASGKDESISPFLTPDSRKWGHNLPLKSAFLSSFCLCAAFFFHFFHPQVGKCLLLLVYVLSGTPALIQTLTDLKKLELNIDVLMTLAALLSVIIGSGFEGGLLLVLFELSAAMELSVLQKTKSALATLHKISPLKASLIEEDGHLVEKSIKDISVGQNILIKAGEIVPLDGIVIEGSSYITLSHLTGESTPLSKGVGDEVVAGAHNLEGSLSLRILRTNQDSTLQKIINLVTQAQDSRPKLQNWLDRFDKRYAMTIIALTFFFGMTLPLFFPSLSYLGIEGSVYRALTFLIAASPCALIIATPTAYLSAISSCTKKGILLKGGAILDALTRCRQVAFDKTGTLTTGNLRLTRVEPLNEVAKTLDPQEMLSLAASLERHVKHPIAEALLSYVKENKLPFLAIEDLKSIPGSGLQAKYRSSLCSIGSRLFISSLFPFSIPDDITTSSTQTYLLVQGGVFVFHFQDELRKESKDLIRRLEEHLHIKTIMLTGDEDKNAQHIAKQLQMKNVFSHLKPEDKLNKVASLSQSEGLIMIGDGVNDAPALAKATVGISLGKIGSSSAIAASDIVFLQDDLSSLDWLLLKANKTQQIIKQNLSLALFVICFISTPALLGYIPLWLAVVLHEGGTLLVGVNSLRLLKK